MRNKNKLSTNSCNKTDPMFVLLHAQLRCNAIQVMFYLVLKGNTYMALKQKKEKHRYIHQDLYSIPELEIKIKTQKRIKLKIEKRCA